MKAKLYGFHLEVHAAINVAEFFRFVSQRGSLSFKGVDRHIFTGTSTDYMSGLILSKRDRDKIPESKPDPGGRLTMNILENTPGHTGQEFNIFIYNPATLRGSYLSYHGAASINVFRDYMKDQYSKMMTSMIQLIRNDQAISEEDKALR